MTNVIEYIYVGEMRKKRSFVELGCLFRKETCDTRQKSFPEMNPSRETYSRDHGKRTHQESWSVF